MNFFQGEAREGGVHVPGLGDVSVPGPQAATGKITVGVRPNPLQLAEVDSHRVELSEQLGGVSYHHLTTSGDTRIIVEARDQQAPRIGSRVGLRFDPANACFFDAESGAQLR